jgi:CRP/FNR family transcriptional regulator
MNEKFDSLKSLPFFSGLSHDDLALILKTGTEINFNAQETIFLENTFLKGLYILEKGRVKIYKLSSDGKEQILHYVNDGETFAGAPIFLKEAKYPASAEAVIKSKLLLITKDSLLKLIKENSNFAMKILESFSNYLIKLVSLVDDLSLKDVSKRLAKYLVDLADNNGVISTPTKHNIASELGTVREVISRTLSQFQKNKLIQINGKKIIILNHQKLKELISE